MDQLLETLHHVLDSDDSEADEELELLLESSSSSDEDVALFMSSKKRRQDLHKTPRIENYVERTVASYNAEEFKSHFRLLPDTFEFLLGLIGPKISHFKRGQKQIEVKKQLLLTLWVMATPDSYRSVCEKFGVGKATAIRAVRRVSHALYSLAPQYIQWPQGTRAECVMRDFETYSAFPQIIGAIDGTHISINAPKEDAQSYINRKGSHSIHVQAVCTRDMLFTSMFAGNVGSVHDSRVFRLSPVQNYIENESYFPGDSHIVGDAAYGIHPRLMVPFKENGHLSRKQKNFNFCLSSARVSIERAFGLWKGRWRSILDRLPMVTMDKIPEYILATAVLHNICILKRDLIPFESSPRTIIHRGPLIPNSREEAMHSYKTHYTVVMGDFNAKLGKRCGDELRVGQFGFGQRNARGQMLADFMERENLFMMNSFFRKPDSRKWTWISLDGEVKNKIDFIMSTKKHIFNNVTVINAVKTTKKKEGLTIVTIGKR